jgi:hypothetical protein
MDVIVRFTRIPGRKRPGYTMTYRRQRLPAKRFKLVPDA